MSSVVNTTGSGNVRLPNAGFNHSPVANIDRNSGLLYIFQPKFQLLFLIVLSNSRKPPVPT
jgi:hypothetical protein